MLKRKYGDRANWKRILKRKYQQTFHHDNHFYGYITLLTLCQVKDPLFVNYETTEVCIADDGYSWLQQFPLDKNHSVTTIFDAKGEVVQWYINICCEIGTTNTIPWMDDLFLDIVVLPSGDVLLLDEDELEETWKTGVIDHSMYVMAKNEAEQILGLVRDGTFALMNLAAIHREIVSLTKES